MQPYYFQDNDIENCSYYNQKLYMHTVVNNSIELTVNAWSCVPWNASIKWMTPPFVASKIILPSELNFTPVHSMLGSFWIWKVENGPYKVNHKEKILLTRYSELFNNDYFSNVALQYSGFNKVSLQTLDTLQIKRY